MWEPACEASWGSRTCTGLCESPEFVPESLAGWGGSRKQTEVASPLPFPGPEPATPNPLYLHTRKLRLPDRARDLLGVTWPLPGNSGTLLLATHYPSSGARGLGSLGSQPEPGLLASCPRSRYARKGSFSRSHRTMSLRCPGIKPPSDLGAPDWPIIRPLLPHPPCGLMSRHPCLRLPQVMPELFFRAPSWASKA